MLFDFLLAIWNKDNEKIEFYKNELKDYFDFGHYNFFSNRRKCSHDNVKSYIYLTEEFYDKTDEIIEELDLFKIDMNQILEGLKKLWSEVLFNDDSFDYYDFKYLCNKFDLDLLYLLIYRPYILTHMMKIPIKNKNYSQLTLLFDYMEEVA